MRTGLIEVPEFPLDVYKKVEKSGSRTEYSLRLSDELVNVGQRISSLPLKYASLMKARASEGHDQDFHSDAATGERAIVYLTDVLDDSNGPIEFQEFGKVLGKAGTFAHYSADESHKGCASNIDRYALTMAFDDSDRTITTVGTESCVGITCPAGYKKKGVLPTEDPFNEETCCEKDNALVKAIIVAGLLFAIYYFFFM